MNVAYHKRFFLLMLLVLPWLTNVLLPVPTAAQVQKAHEMIQSANSRLRRGGTRMDGT